MQCVKCHGSGKCQPCKGSGRSGNSGLVPVKKLTKDCPWCKGAKSCNHCGGSGDIPEPKFRPYIHVERSLLIPTSITAAAFTGAPWRFLQIPSWVQEQAEEKQLEWVSRRAQLHCTENDGKLFLFGDITGYRWVKSRDVSVMLDIKGRYLETKLEEFVPGGPHLTVGNKTLKVRQDGTLKIDASTKLQ